MSSSASQKPTTIEPRQTANDQARERPILFSAPMVRALLDGRKTQTRRIVKGAALDWLDSFTPEFVASAENRLCPYGVPGDVLWVRETLKRAPHLWTYAADGEPVGWPARQGLAGKTRDTVVSIHMPRDACRLRLRITDVRVERLNYISDADCEAEGVREPSLGDTVWSGMFGMDRASCHPRIAYAVLWDSIHGDRAWDLSPWVWVVTFAPLAASEP